MTHELHPNAEADPGPEHDRTLPNAAEVPVWRDPDDATAVADEQAVITLTDDEQDGDD